MRMILKKNGLKNNGFMNVGMSSILVFAFVLSLSSCSTNKQSGVVDNQEEVKKADLEALQAAEKKIKALKDQYAALQVKVNEGTASKEEVEELKKLEAELQKQLKDAQGKVEGLTSGLDTANKNLATTSDSLNKLKESIVLEATHAEITSYTTIKVDLSHDADDASLKAVSNYTISGEKNDHPAVAGIKVTSVEVVSPKEVVLTTNKRLISMKYTLDVKGKKTPEETEGIKAVNEEILSKDSKIDNLIPGGTRMVFVTEATSTGDLRNLVSPLARNTEGYAVANKVCQDEADAQKLKGKYSAMISYNGNDDPAYFEEDVMYIRADGLGPIRIGRTDRTDVPGAQLSLPIDVFANGKQADFSFDDEEISKSILVYTAYNPTTNTFETGCGNGEWTSTSGSVSTGMYRNRSAHMFLGGADGTPCGAEARLLCAQTESAKAGEDAWPVAKDEVDYSGDNYIFVTSVQTTGNIAQALNRELGDISGLQGALAADALCAHLAEEAGKSSSTTLFKKAKDSFSKNFSKYRAILSGGTGTALVSAHERFTVDPLSGTGSYHLPNGIKVADSLEDFFDREKVLAAPVAMTENGDYIRSDNNQPWLSIYANQVVYTGVNLSGDAVAENCAGWTSDAVVALGNIGHSSDAYFRFIFADVDKMNAPCSRQARLYCAYDKDK